MLKASQSHYSDSICTKQLSWDLNWFPKSNLLLRREQDDILNTHWLCLSIRIILSLASLSSHFWVLDMEICLPGAGPTISLLGKMWRWHQGPGGWKNLPSHDSPVMAGHICHWPQSCYSLAASAFSVISMKGWSLDGISDHLRRA